MKKVLAPIAILALALSATIPTTRAAGANSLVRADPFQGHPGSAIYLSGSGFAPESVLSLTITCGPAVYPGGAVRTDGHGRFVAHRIVAPHVLSARGIHCRINAAGGEIPASYVLIPSRKPLGQCAVRMCIRARAAIVRLRNGTIGQILVHGWPGARARITIVHANGKRVSRATNLDWRGNGLVRLRVSLGLKKAVTYRVAVYTWLGPFKGHTTTRFIVIPGGR